MPFGFSFGKNKEKVDNTTTVDRNETTNQTQTGNRSSTGSTKGTVDSSAISNTQGSQIDQSRTASQTSGLTAAEQRGSQTLFGDQILGQLEGVVSALLGGTPAAGTPIGNFDGDKFVADGVQAARAQQKLSLDDSINKLFSSVGGTAGGNSAVALLANQLQGNFAANIAGVESDLTAQANDITRRNTETGLAVAGQQQNFLGSLLSQLRGGRTATTGNEITSQAQQQAGVTAGSSQTSQTSQQASTQQSTQTQELVELLSQVLSGTTRTQGTESNKGTVSKSGGGFGFSL